MTMFAARTDPPVLPLPNMANLLRTFRDKHGSLLTSSAVCSMKMLSVNLMSDTDGMWHRFFNNSTI